MVAYLANFLAVATTTLLASAIARKETGGARRVVAVSFFITSVRLLLRPSIISTTDNRKTLLFVPRSIERLQSDLGFVELLASAIARKETGGARRVVALSFFITSVRLLFASVYYLYHDLYHGQ